MIEINYFAVLVGAVVAMVVGSLWYGLFYGKEWMKAIGITQKNIEKAKNKGMAGTYVLAFLGALVMSFFMAVTVDVFNAPTVVSGALVGIFVWAGFVATTHMPHYLFDGRPVALYKIAVTYHLVELILVGALLAAWK